MLSKNGRGNMVVVERDVIVDTITELTELYGAGIVDNTSVIDRLVKIVEGHDASLRTAVEPVKYIPWEHKDA